MKKFEGLITAPFTAFNQDGSINLNMVEQQQSVYKKNGLSGAFVCGSTGEGPALTLDEKKQLFKAWAKHSTESFNIIGFLGGTCVKECQELAIYAKECGLDAVAVTSPYYFKPANVGALATFCQEVAAAVPDMPFFYYHIPCLTGVNFPMIDLLEQMDSMIPNLAGIKYTYENMMDYQLCLNFKSRKYNIMWGRDEMLLPALSIGATAAVGSTYGYNAPIYNKIIEAYKAGNMEQAADLQLQANVFITLLNKYGGGCGKAFMKAIGLDLGSCRAPLITLDEAQYQALLKDLSTMPFERYKCKL